MLRHGGGTAEEIRLHHELSLLQIELDGHKNMNEVLISEKTELRKELNQLEQANATLNREIKISRQAEGRAKREYDALSKSFNEVVHELKEIEEARVYLEGKGY